MDAFQDGVFALRRNELEHAISQFEKAGQLRDGGDVKSFEGQVEVEIERISPAAVMLRPTPPAPTPPLVLGDQP